MPPVGGSAKSSVSSIRGAPAGDEIPEGARGSGGRFSGWITLPPSWEYAVRSGSHVFEVPIPPV